jgi:hypothetical protein
MQYMKEAASMVLEESAAEYFHIILEEDEDE